MTINEATREARERAMTQGNEVYNLCRRCGVGMDAACRQIGMDRTTPHRWKADGSTPGPGKVQLLRHSILLLAHKRGTLPDAFRAELDKLGADALVYGVEIAKHRHPVAILRDLNNGFRELAQAMHAHPDDVAAVMPMDEAQP